MTSSICLLATTSELSSSNAINLLMEAIEAIKQIKATGVGLSTYAPEIKCLARYCLRGAGAEHSPALAPAMSWDFSIACDHAVSSK